MAWCALVGQNAIHWDMSRFYSSHESASFQNDKKKLVDGLRDFSDDTESFAFSDVDYTEVRLDSWADSLCRLEDLEALYIHLWMYVLCRLATGGHDEVCIAEHSAVTAIRTQLDNANTIAGAALSRLQANTFDDLLAHSRLDGAGHRLRNMRRAAHFKLSDENEQLANDLHSSSYSAWAALRNKIANELTFSMTWPDGRCEMLPVSRQFDLMSSPDNTVRENAATGIDKAWESRQDSIAACLNGIAATRIALSRHRGRKDVLEQTLDDNWIDRKTQETMMSVVAANKHIWWRYLQLKAVLLGKDKLAIHDRLALLPLNSSHTYDVCEAADMVVASFSSALPGLAAYSRKAIDSSCVEYANGPGYSGTGIPGFAFHSPRLKETRVYTEYHGSLVDINIFAHELGHGYHSHTMLDLRPWQMDYPGTLAESASTVAEGIFRHSLMNNPSNSLDLKLQALGMQLDSSVNYLLRIPRDFEFEQRFFRQREQGELSAWKIRALMADSHRQWFGDCLDSNYNDEMHWASRAYFCYDNGYFINYHYTFGFLFSAALLRRVVAEGSAFDKPYQALLRDTGSMNVEALAEKHLGVDITSAEFWQEEIDHLSLQIDQFEQLAQHRFAEKFANVKHG